MLLDQAAETPRTIDNVGCRLGDDIAGFLKPDTAVYVASTGFSLSAFEHLAEELERVKAVRFVLPFCLPQRTQRSQRKEASENDG